MAAWECPASYAHPPPLQEAAAEWQRGAGQQLEGLAARLAALQQASEAAQQQV